MADRDENSRALGGLICLATLLAGALFLYGLAVRSYWALALPVAAFFLFVLGLVFWIGWTITTVEIDARGAPLETNEQTNERLNRLKRQGLLD